jgi:tetratricopeptide (TPR) repeat protein
MLIVLRVVAYGYVASPTFLRPWTDNLLTEVEVVVQYIKLWLLPFPLSIYHEYPVVSPPGTVLTWLSAALLMALLGLALRSQRRAPALCFGLLAAALTLAPTSSIFALKETMAEHRTYLPSLGYAFVCAWCFGGPVARRVGPRLAGLILMAVVLGNSVLHHSYQRLWSNEEVLWSHAVRVNPNASDAWRYLGDLYLGQGRMEDSERAFEKAVGTRPTSAEALTKLGLVRAHRGDLDAGHELFTRALEAANCYSPALNNLALVQRRRKDVHSAIDIYHRSLLCKVDNYRAHIGLGDIYYGEVKNREKAAEHYGFALQFMDPMHPDAAMIKTRLLELTW